MQYRYVALASFAALTMAAPVPSEEIDWNNTPENQDLAKRTFPFFSFWKDFLPSSMRTAFEDNSGSSGGISGASDDSDAGGDSEMAKRQAIEAENHTKSKSHHHQEFPGGHHGPGVGHHPGDGNPGYRCVDMKHGSATEGRCVGHHKPAGKGNGKEKPPAGAAVARRADEEKA